ncbi:glycosyltransferase family 2 protein [Geomonas oryzae]|uniref:glycosyltransferase family 2 protein n=1 Tax=Geomonas oryzae TaxID=2364273 RepID=UPI00100A301A|nr:glycosyltransferase family 2 protein [Geomonas oryzae]
MNQVLTSDQRSHWEVPSFEIPLWLGKSRTFCVVIPVVNEGSRIRKLLERMSACRTPEISDIIIVDGGTTDGSLDLELLERCGVRGLLVKTGPGRLSAQLRCAYAFALDHGYQGVVTIDGNDKDDPEAIAAFVEALKDGTDFVQASRYLPGGVAENTPRMRDLAIRWLHAPLLSLCSGFHWTDTTQGFRGYSGRMLVDPEIAPFRDLFAGYELLAYLSFRAPRLGYRCRELPAARRYPATGKVPTKISAFRGNLGLLRVLIMACLSRYNPSPGRGGKC